MNDHVPGEGRPHLPPGPRKRTSIQAPPRRTPADTARGIGALLLLTAFVAGIPALLLLVYPVRSIALPDWSQTIDSLTGPDDGHLFMGALAVVAWLAWVAFALCVVVEAVAVVRGLPSPRLPLLGRPQRAASVLVAAAAVLLTVPPMPGAPASAHEASAPSVATPLAASPAAGRETRPARTPNGSPAATPAGSVPMRSSARTAAVVPTRAATQNQVTVRRGDTLWGLAERHLGSGSRYREIARLNYGYVQPDGRALTDAHWIYPGWVLQLPVNAAGVRSVTSSETSAAREPGAAKDVSYTVRPGDTLWGIAERHLGEGERYREIYRLNAGRAQEVGGRLSDPDVILPGWVLRMPAAVPAVQVHPEEPEIGPTPVVPADPVPSTQAPPDREPTRTPPPAAGADEQSEAVEVPTNTDWLDDSSLQLAQIVLGMTVLASAGLIGEVARRRRRQQRLRRPGERILLATGEAAVVEQTLRTAQDPISLETLRTALSALAANCRVTGRALPRVLVARISSDGLELLTDDVGEAVKPFRRVGPQTWRLDRSAPAAPIDASDHSEPYPALVTVGVAEDSVVLLNLEAAGKLTVVGEDHLPQDVVRALAVELATGPMAGRTVLLLPEALSGLAEVCDASRVRKVTDLEAGRRAAAQEASVAAILAESAVTDLHEARSHDVAADTWTPEIFVAAAPIEAAPWSGVAVIAVGEDAASGWTLKVDVGGRGRLDPLAIDLDVQRLSDDDYDSVISLLGSADSQPESPTQLPDGDPRGGASPEPSSREVQQLVIAALPSPPLGPPGEAGEQSDMAMAPRVLVLGRVEIGGTLEGPSSSRKARATEFVTYLALHPGASAHEIDEAIWPGRRVTKDVRNSFVSRVRHWLGSAPDGQPYLPMVGDQGDYRLSPEVSCDWHDFLLMSRQGLVSGPDGADVLEQALALVRGRPFLGIDPATYCWAEAATQEMISSIVDVAHALSVIRLDKGDARSAQDAAARGLLVEPGSEMLHCDAIRAAARRGDSGEIARLSERLRAQIAAIDPDGGVGQDTAELLRQAASGAN